MNGLLCCMPTLSPELKIWRFHVVTVNWTTTKKCAIKRVPDVQHEYFSNLTNHILAWWRCRCLNSQWALFARRPYWPYAKDFAPRASSWNVWERVSVRNNKSFQCLGTQHGCRVMKASRPFATNDHMVQNPPCWRASSLLFPHWDFKTKASQAWLVQVSLF